MIRHLVLNLQFLGLFGLSGVLGTIQQYISSKYAKSVYAAESKACNLQECKGKGLEKSNASGDTDVFPVVRIGGAILHPR